MKENKYIIYSVKDNIGILSIENGSKNMISKPEFLDLQYLDTWIKDNQLKALIITSKGKHFSIGADIDNIKASRAYKGSLEKQLNRGKEILTYIEKLNIVTIAAISGICFGAGFEIALACQHRICTQNTILAFPESNIGVMPGLGGNLRLAKLIGKSAASEIIITGRTITSEEALEKGIVSKVVPNKCHVQEAYNFVQTLTEGKTVAQINSILAVMNEGEISYKKGQALESHLFEELAKNIE